MLNGQRRSFFVVLFRFVVLFVSARNSALYLLTKASFPSLQWARSQFALPSQGDKNTDFVNTK